MLTCPQAARLMNLPAKQLMDWAEKGKVVALWDSKRRAFKLPAWQFQQAIWIAVPRVTRAFRGDGWQVFNFFETPAGALNGRTPRQALEAGYLSSVVELASAE